MKKADIFIEYKQIEYLQKILYLFIGIFSFVCVFTLGYGIYKMKMTHTLSWEPVTAYHLKSPFVQPLGFFHQVVSRKLFEVQQIVRKPAGPVVRAKTREELQMYINRFTLMGIIWDDIPQVFLAKKGTEESFYLKQGDSVEGIVVKKITNSSVLLEYEGEELELHL